MFYQFLRVGNVPHLRHVYISHFLFHLLTIQPHHQNSLVSLTYDWGWNLNAIRTHQNVNQPCSTRFPCNSSVNTFFWCFRTRSVTTKLVFQGHNETVRFKIYQSWTLEVPTVRPHSLQRWCSMRSSRMNSWTCHRIRLPISNHDFVFYFDIIKIKRSYISWEWSIQCF